MIDDRATCDVCGVENFEDRSHLHPPPPISKKDTTTSLGTLPGDKERDLTSRKDEK
jgi:hypothetical protein